MGDWGASEQIPILCGTCGAPVAHRADLSLRCPYCGTEDRLPADELGRALELKRRVALAAKSVVQFDRTQAALAHIFEERRAFLRVQGSWLVVLGFVLAYTVAGSWSVIASAPPAFRAGLALQAATGPMFVGGIALSFAVALFVGRVGYRRRVRPLLLARPARTAGGPMRCRSCGGDLPDQRGPLIRCSYCSTQSLVTPEVQLASERLLSAEEEAYRSRASGAVAATTRGSVHMTRTLVISVVVVYLLQLALAFAASALLPRGP